jgi:hypothetical protein
MKSDSMPVEIHLPSLSDEAAVEVHDFLNELLLLVESHYFAQIHRHYQNQFSNNLGQSPPHRHPSDNVPPF